MSRQVRGRQAERVGLHLERRPANKCVARQRIDLAHLLVGHGKAAGRQAVAVDHEQAAAAVVRFVEAVREAGVDRKIKAGIGIHQLGGHCVEPLWSLTVALIQLRPKIAGPAADRIGLEDLETASSVLLPDFELRLFLENAHEDRRMLRHLLLPEQREQLARHRLCCLARQRRRLRLCRLARHLRRRRFCCPTRQLFSVVAKARDRRQCRGKSRRQH